MREFIVRLNADTAYDLHRKVWAVMRDIYGRDASPRFQFREAGGFVKIRHDMEGGPGRPAIRPEKGKVYGFDVLVNPTVNSRAVSARVADPVKKRVIERIVRRIGDYGMEVVRIDGHYRAGRLFDKPGNKKRFRILEFLAYGELRVVDADKASALIETGLGPMKRFGYGMIDLHDPEVM